MGHGGRQKGGKGTRGEGRGNTEEGLIGLTRKNKDENVETEDGNKEY